MKKVSHEGTKKLSAEELSVIVIDEAFHIHNDLAPGMLESVYQKVLTAVLKSVDLLCKLKYRSLLRTAALHFNAELRMDLVIEKKLVIELKSVEQTLPVYKKQLLTYLKLTGINLWSVNQFWMCNF